MRKIGKVSKNTSTKGQNGVAKSANCCAPKVEVLNSSETGLCAAADKAEIIMPVSDDPNPSVAGPASIAEKARMGTPATEGDISLIKAYYTDYMFAMGTRQKLDNGFRAYLLRQHKFDREAPEPEKKAIKAKVESIMKNPEGTGFEAFAAGVKEARKPFDLIELRLVKSMKALAMKLPVWESFGKAVKGFGEKSLAVIVGEAGDLSNYPKKPGGCGKSALWKRLGLAVLDGVRQGGLAKGSSAQAWIAHGYNRKRRAQIWVIGDTMLKAQIRQLLSPEQVAGIAPLQEELDALDKSAKTRIGVLKKQIEKIKKDGDTGERIALGKYGEKYLRRKAYEFARDPEITKAHAHASAKRYMEKKLIRDLWAAWRAASVVRENASLPLPAEIQKAA